MYDVIIIGSGPAGYSAGIYTSRAFLKTLILTGVQQGGQLTTTTEIENFPGFPKGILGAQLMMDMSEQAKRFGTEIVAATCQSVKASDASNKASEHQGVNASEASNKASEHQGVNASEVGDKRQETGKTFAVTADGKTYEGKTVIVATGASAMYLGLPSEERLKGKGVSGCATCDGFFFRGKEVVVLGGGDTAMEEANFLTTFASKVTLIHRREEFRASPIMLERVKKNPKITLLLNKTVEEMVGETAVTGIRLKDTKTGESMLYPTQGIFLAIGHKPSTEFLKDTVLMDVKGYVLAGYGLRVAGSEEKGVIQTATSVSGIFAAGDCVDKRYRQAIVAAGQGCMAALDAQKYLEEL